MRALGHGSPVTIQPIPKLVQKLADVQSIFAGPNHAACITETETYIWGVNTSGYDPSPIIHLAHNAGLAGAFYLYTLCQGTGQ